MNPSSDRPEPVLEAAKLAAAVSGVVLSIGALFVLIGWVTADQVQNWAVIAGGVVTSVGALLAVVLPIITAYGARAQVTPLANPISVDGIPLITSAAVPGAVRVLVDDRDITEVLRDLAPPPAPSTRPLPTVGDWRPSTPAAAAAEPTPIATQTEAAMSAQERPL